MKYISEKLNIELYTRAKHLFDLHKDEVSLIDRPLDPDLLMILSTDNIACYIENDDKDIIGYSFYIMFRHLHYNMKVAQQDILYLHPDYRKGTTGIKLIKYSEKILKECGVEYITHSTKRNRDASKLFEYLGYKESDIIFCKDI